MANEEALQELGRDKRGPSRETRLTSHVPPTRLTSRVSRPPITSPHHATRRRRNASNAPPISSNSPLVGSGTIVEAML